MVFCLFCKGFPRRALSLRKTPSSSSSSLPKPAQNPWGPSAEGGEAVSRRAQSCLELRMDTVQASSASEWEWVDLRRWDLVEEDEEGSGKEEGEGGGTADRAEEKERSSEVPLVGLGRLFLPHPPAPFPFSDPFSPPTSSSSGSTLSKSDSRRSQRRLSSPPS